MEIQRRTSTSDESIIAVPLTRDPVRSSSERDSLHGLSFGQVVLDELQVGERRLSARFQLASRVIEHEPLR